MWAIVIMDAAFVLGIKCCLVSSLVLMAVCAKTTSASTKGVSPLAGGQQFGRRRHHGDGDLNRWTEEVGTGPARTRETLRRKEGELGGKIVVQPAACVWAVLACCAPTNFHFRFGCFPYLGCSTLFWQSDPCQFQIVMRAAEEAAHFYKQFDKRPTGTTQPTTPAVTTFATTTHPPFENFTSPPPNSTLAAELATTTLTSDPVTTTTLSSDPVTTTTVPV